MNYFLLMALCFVPIDQTPAKIDPASFMTNNWIADVFRPLNYQKAPWRNPLLPDRRHIQAAGPLIKNAISAEPSRYAGIAGWKKQSTWCHCWS